MKSGDGGNKSEGGLTENKVCKIRQRCKRCGQERKKVAADGPNGPWMLH